jgi:hypothetical protein
MILAWKGLSLKNAPAYNFAAQITALKSFAVLT